MFAEVGSDGRDLHVAFLNNQLERSFFPRCVGALKPERLLRGRLVVCLQPVPGNLVDCPNKTVAKESEPQCWGGQTVWPDEQGRFFKGLPTAEILGL